MRLRFRPHLRLRHLTAVAALSASLSSALVFGFATACSSTTTEPAGTTGTPDAADAADETLEVELQDAAPTQCTIVKGITTGVKVCDDCLQKNCCGVINACYTDKGCEALNLCITNCGKTLGTGDAGAQCTRDCAKGKDPEATKLLDMLTCENERCGTDCK